MDLAEAVRLADVFTADQVNQLMVTAQVRVKKDEPVKKNHPWEVMLHPTFAHIVGFMADTGMQPLEIAGVRWQDVSLDKLSIDVTVQAFHDGKSVKPLKTASERRVVPMCMDFAAILREQKKDGDVSLEGPVFVTSRGVRPTAVGLVAICRKLAPHIGMDLTLYLLRHFYASKLITSGVSVKAVRWLWGTSR